MGQNVFMPISSEFKAKFIARTQKARERAGLTQDEIAEQLGMKQSKYHKYESRSILPHYLIPDFCLQTKVTLEWLYTSAIEVKALPAPKKKRRKRKAA